MISPATSLTSVAGIEGVGGVACLSWGLILAVYYRNNFRRPSSRGNGQSLACPKSWPCIVIGSILVSGMGHSRQRVTPSLAITWFPIRRRLWPCCGRSANGAAIARKALIWQWQNARTARRHGRGDQYRSDCRLAGRAATSHDADVALCRTGAGAGPALGAPCRL